MWENRQFEGFFRKEVQIFGGVKAGQLLVEVEVRYTAFGWVIEDGDVLIRTTAVRLRHCLVVIVLKYQVVVRWMERTGDLRVGRRTRSKASRSWLSWVPWWQRTSHSLLRLHQLLEAGGQKQNQRIATYPWLRCRVPMSLGRCMQKRLSSRPVPFLAFQLLLLSFWRQPDRDRRDTEGWPK